MKVVFDFIVENWRPLLEVVLLIFSCIVFLLRKKPVKVVDSLKDNINRLLPGLINLAELQNGLSGEAKKQFVLDNIKPVLVELGFGDDVIDQYLPFIKSQIEVLLSTPQKKKVR